MCSRVTIGTQPLTLGSTVNGAIDVTGDQDRYTFTLGATSLVYFDALTNNVGVTWTLSGPAGTPVLNRSFGTTAPDPNPQSGCRRVHIDRGRGRRGYRRL